MTTTLKHRKKSIIAYLSDIQDEALILQIENLLKPFADIWEELTDAQKATIHLGVQQLREGKSVDYQSFRTERPSSRELPTS